MGLVLPLLLNEREKKGTQNWHGAAGINAALFSSLSQGFTSNPIVYLQVERTFYPQVDNRSTHR